MNDPKYKIGQAVKMSHPDLYNETDGVITEIRKVYQQLGPDGEFDMEGLATSDSTLECLSVPYEIKGDILTIFSTREVLREKELLEPETLERVTAFIKVKLPDPRVSKLRHFSYVVQTKKMSTMISEPNVRPK